MALCASLAGRDPATIGIDGSLRVTPQRSVEDLSKQVSFWNELGASHVRVARSGGELPLQGKIDELVKLRGVLKDADV